MFDNADFMEFVRDLAFGHAELLTGKTITGGTKMGRVNDLWADEIEAKAEPLIEAGMDPADAYEQVAGRIIDEPDVEVLLAEKEMEGRNV